MDDCEKIEKPNKDGRLNLGDIRQSFIAAVPIILGYAVLGIPCGILCQKAGMNWIMVLCMSVFFYSGAGQYMIANMWISSAAIPAIITSVVLVNLRQILYGSALSRYLENTGKAKAILMASNVTDESFGVNLAKFKEGNWKTDQAYLVNIFSQSSWTIFNIVGFAIGATFAFNPAIASFAMTSIFICLLMMQKGTSDNIIAALAAIIGVIFCKLVGLSEVAILFGALFGVCIALITSLLKTKNKNDSSKSDFEVNKGDDK